MLVAAVATPSPFTDYATPRLRRPEWRRSSARNPQVATPQASKEAHNSIHNRKLLKFGTVRISVSQSMPGPLTCFDSPLTFQKSRSTEGAALGPLTSSHCHIQHLPISPLKNSTQNDHISPFWARKSKNFLEGSTTPSPDSSSLGTPLLKPHPSAPRP